MGEHFDWRQHGILDGPPPTQNGGTCWAHAVVATIEASLQKQGVTNVTPSVQELIDCCDVCGGSNGGYIMDAYRHIKRKNITSSAEYSPSPVPNPARGPCRRCNENLEGRVGITDFKKITDMSVDGLKKAVRRRPLALIIYCGPLFRDNTTNNILMDGIYPYMDEPNEIFCHAVVLLGFGTDTGVPYWIFRNSWGPNWGGSYTLFC